MKAFVKKKDVLARLGNEVKNVAIYADNLSKEQAKSVAKFMKSMVEKYPISDKFGKLFPNVLHENLNFYGPKNSPVNPDDVKKMEFFQLLISDEIWVFDNGYDNFTQNGRLDKLFEHHTKSVKFLCMSPDGNDWDFYCGNDYVVSGDEDNIECYSYYIVESIETENVVSTVKQAKPMRVLGSEQMSDDENRLARKAICMSQVLGDLSIRAMVRNDNELDKKINKLLRSSNKVLFGILLSEKCNENELKAYDANLDFTEADIIELRKAYAI